MLQEAAAAGQGSRPVQEFSHDSCLDESERCRHAGGEQPPFKEHNKLLGMKHHLPSPRVACAQLTGPPEMVRSYSNKDGFKAFEPLLRDVRMWTNKGVYGQQG